MLLKQVLNALPAGVADLQDLFGGIEFVMEGNALGFIGMDNPVRKVPPCISNAIHTRLSFGGRSNNPVCGQIIFNVLHTMYMDLFIMFCILINCL